MASRLAKILRHCERSAAIQKPRLRRHKKTHSAPMALWLDCRASLAMTAEKAQ